MRRTRLVLLLIGCLQWISLPNAEAQIPYVTMRTPRTPGPPMALVRTNAPGPTGPTVPAEAAPVARPMPVPVRRVLLRPAPPPSLDKAEVERRVLAFQQKRALEGFESAQYLMGIRYLNGDGVVQDIPTARKWLSKAAEAGHAEARKKLRELDAAAKAEPVAGP